MKKQYSVPTVEYILFKDENGLIATCSDDCSSCYYFECTPSDCYIASPSNSSVVPDGPAIG